MSALRTGRSPSRPLYGTTVVAGIGQTPFYKRGKSPDSERKQILRAIVAACTDAGIAPHDIDGFATYSDDRQNATYLMHELGTRELRWSSMVEGGGGGGVPAAVGAAAAAILTGQAEVVVVYRSVSEREMGRFNTAIESQHATSHYTAHGICVAAQMMALRTQRMLHTLGVSRDIMEGLVLADYFHARSNPRATAYRNTLDAATYRAARWIAEPYRLYDCSRESDGAAAIIVTAAQRAQHLRQAPVYLLAIAQGNPRHGGETLDNSDDYDLAGFGSIAPRLWQQAGMSAADVDVLQVYENFSGLGIAALLEHGFCTRDNISEILRYENLIAPHGKLPTNTSGGCLAEGFIHGMEVLLEAVRQLRGESSNPVPGAEVCLVTGGPGSTYTSSALFGTAATL